MNSETGRINLWKIIYLLLRQLCLEWLSFPESYQIDDMYGVGARALVVAVNQFDSRKVNLLVIMQL